MAPRRLWHVVRAVLFMLRKGMSKRKLAMDLQLLLQRGKIAGGKALGKLMSTTHHDKPPAASNHSTSAKAKQHAPPNFSCPARSVYDPRETEFSCSNTPSSYYPSILHQLVPTKQRQPRRWNGSRRRTGSHRGANGGEPGWYNYDAADIAKVFEVLNKDEQLLNDVVAVVANTPSPALWSSSFGRSPAPAAAPVRQLRITDSPFPLSADDAQDGGMVDQEADEFIKKFYDQLRKQQQSLTAATPEYGYASPAATGVAY